ncbi:hypothetical protein [Amycolatopsis taiwanensis]|uniref:hypothetical protein n=1 Tax=Amycolatopsis taiwanensis TaxID=342230 RepID=UPI0004BCE85F|nr:hypothetical protein [Amycolatopsis taiwanensis]
MTPELLAKLAAPFPDDAVGSRPEITCQACKVGGCTAHKWAECAECGRTLTTAHVHLDYVGHAYVRERLNSVDPDWAWEPMALTPEGLPLLQDGCLWIRLTVGGKTVLGVGDAPGKRGGVFWKELIGDAIRNAAMTMGVALDMWKREPASAGPLPVEPDADPAAEPVDEPAPADVPDEPTKLRERIRDITKRRGRSAAQTAADFTKWSKGKQLLRANTALLAEYLDHLLQEGKR